MQYGTISNWNEDKGFGFIVSTSGGKAIFTHISDYSKSHRKPSKGLQVQYILANDAKGRICAVKVVPLNGHKKRSTPIRQTYSSMLLLLSFTSITIFFFNNNLMPITLIALYTAMSIITFIIYANDKSAARTDAWRTPERTLHTLSLFGGWPGATLAQSFLSHKSKKPSFKVTHWVTIVANCGVVYWLITP
ncbi:MAG: cold shock and DUF1294 domain-containing protein [Pseudomonadota bacterium]|nr:cold shock and DUF1294 domain-containing protein [Pseudomonadota bacterium]MDO7711167.1 cold shock and DUF1294 domain-containing protein [Pseudomonadota bacterium]